MHVCSRCGQKTFATIKSKTGKRVCQICVDAKKEDRQAAYQANASASFAFRYLS